MQFDGFDWDVGNWNKCQKHGASVAEIESLFAGPLRVVPDPAHSATEQRLRAVGRSASGRWIFVAFTWRRNGDRALIRPISARPMRDKEVRFYEALPDPHQ
ncbi:BrnT family toxin [Lichenibacterium dinghuense]|uniref:BrnT family toxin n=1 Tax=Lichenibacterium dinghuense TaxID=2895977 RepID=UPI001F341424|nr:BrnT family toxin [Lichenibacterium sp. 6Y81]